MRAAPFGSVANGSSGEVERRRLSWPEDPNVAGRCQLPGVRGEPFTSLDQRPVPPAMQVARIERPPVDRHHGDRRDVARYLRRGPRAEMARPQMWSPGPDGKEGK